MIYLCNTCHYLNLQASEEDELPLNFGRFKSHRELIEHFLNSEVCLADLLVNSGLLVDDFELTGCCYGDAVYNFSLDEKKSVLSGALRYFAVNNGMIHERMEFR